MQFPVQQRSAATGGTAADSASDQEALPAEPSAPAAVVIATTFDRVSRQAGLLEILRQQAQQRNVSVIVLLQASSVLDAVQQMSGGQVANYAAACLGSAMASRASSTTQGQELLHAFNQQVAHSHAATKHAAMQNPVLCPVALDACDEGVFSS